MLLELENLLARELVRFFHLVLFILSAVWVGSMVSGLAWFFGNWDLTPDDLLFAIAALWSAPALLMNEGIILNFGLLVLGTTILFLTDRTGYGEWGVIVGIESIFALFGKGYRYEPVSVLVITALSWLVLLVMVETGVWLIRHMRMNRWVREWAALSAENALHRAEREANARNPAGDEPDTGEVLK